MNTNKTMTQAYYLCLESPKCFSAAPWNDREIREGGNGHDQRHRLQNTCLKLDKRFNWTGWIDRAQRNLWCSCKRDIGHLGIVIISANLGIEIISDGLNQEPTMSTRWLGNLQNERWAYFHEVNLTNGAVDLQVKRYENLLRWQALGSRKIEFR